MVSLPWDTVPDYFFHFNNIYRRVSIQKEKLTISRKKKILYIFFLFLFSVSFSQEERFTITDYLEYAPVEEWARYYFSLGIEKWGESDYKAARENIENAFFRPMYATDIPKIWYFLAKLNIEAGLSKESVESLNNVLLIQPDRTEILILLQALKAISEVEKKDNPVLGIQYFSEIKGFVNYFEYFYNPVDSEIFKDEVYVLDRANRFIYVSGIKNNRLLNLEMEAPSSMVFDSLSGSLYVSDLSSGKVYSLNPETGEIIREFSGFEKPFVKAVDRMGNFYVIDPPLSRISVVSSKGKILKYIFLNEGYTPNIVTDLDVECNMVVLQDLTLKAFRIISIPSFEETGTVSFPEMLIPVTSCFDNSGNLLTVWNNGSLSIINLLAEPEYQVLDTTNIDLIGISDIDFSAPLLTVTDFDDHLVKTYLLVKQNPDSFTLIDGLEVEEDILNIYFRNILISGDRFQMIFPFINVYDSGGFVPFTGEYIKTPLKYFIIENGASFFEHNFNNLNTSNFNVILWKYDGYDINFESIAPAFLHKNAMVIILTNLSVPKKVQRFASVTGGMVTSSEMISFLIEYLDGINFVWSPKVFYKLSLPFEGIKTVTVSSRILGMDYSDSIYYINYMIPSLKESLIDTLIE